MKIGRLFRRQPWRGVAHELYATIVIQARRPEFYLRCAVPDTPDGRFDAKAYRDRSGIGRNVTIEVLEFLDRAGLTRRRGDVREIVAPAASLFGAAGNGATSDTASRG